MARISGVDLPREKRVEVGLTYIYGIGRRKSEAFARQKLIKSLIAEHLFNACLSLVKVSFDTDHKGILSLLCHHLLFLNRTHTVFRVKYDDLRALNIGKSRKGCFSRIPGCSCKYHDLVMNIVFTGTGDQKMRQY